LLFKIFIYKDIQQYVIVGGKLDSNLYISSILYKKLLKNFYISITEIT